MKIVIIGAEGQVGHFLFKHLSDQHQVWGTAQLGVDGFPALDIQNPSAVTDFLDHRRPDHVILTAALTHVDRCETEPGLAEAINVKGTEQVAKACRAIGAGLTFFSTDYIFDGQTGPYQETDTPNPLSVYGRTKLEGEKIVAGLLEDYRIVRTMVVFSYLPGSLNIFMQIKERLEKNLPIAAPSDQMINPTHALNLAQATAELIENKQTGIFNIAGTTRLLRDAFTRQVVSSFGGNPDAVTSITTADLKQKARRPLNSGLKTDKAQQVLKHYPLWDLDYALQVAQKQRRVSQAS
jgi:dTDP-4-dehydrorhamnose reductase